MRHTPGPWTVKVIDTISDEPAYWHITDTHGGVVGDVQSVNAADARLIAAAPDLLAALKHALERFEAIPDHRDEIGVYRKAAQMARAAIAQAEGDA